MLEVKLSDLHKYKELYNSTSIDLRGVRFKGTQDIHDVRDVHQSVFAFNRGELDLYYIIYDTEYLLINDNI